MLAILCEQFFYQHHACFLYKNLFILVCILMYIMKLCVVIIVVFMEKFYPTTTTTQEQCCKVFYTYMKQLHDRYNESVDVHKQV